MPLYLGYGNLVVCEDHKTLVSLVRATPLGERESEYHGLAQSCMVCDTPAEPGRLCANTTCEKPLHEQWPGFYCSAECAWRDARR